MQIKFLKCEHFLTVYLISDPSHSSDKQTIWWRCFGSENVWSESDSWLELQQSVN